jgi:hypothetical protein
MFKRVVTIIIIVVIAVILSVLTSHSWENVFLEKISSLLFKFFLPGIWLSMQVSGGPHSSSEINVAIGVFFQFMIIYFLVGYIFLKIKKGD